MNQYLALDLIRWKRPQLLCQQPAVLASRPRILESLIGVVALSTRSPYLECVLQMLEASPRVEKGRLLNSASWSSRLFCSLKDRITHSRCPCLR